MQRVSLLLGGTGAGSAADARTNLDVPGLSVANEFTALNDFGAGARFDGARGDNVAAGGMVIDYSSGARFNTNGTLFDFATGTDGSARQFRIAHTATAVNYISVFGGASGSPAELVIQSGETNAGMTFSSYGAGSFKFATAGAGGAGNGNNQLIIAHTASATNYLQVTGANAGPPSISAIGASATISMNYVAKAGGVHNFYNDSGSSILLSIAQSSTPAVEYMQIVGASLGNHPYIAAQGASSDVNFRVSSKGSSGVVQFYTSSMAALQMQVSHTASAVNFLQVSGSITTNAIPITASGSDTNIGINLVPKGAGVVSVSGAFSATTVAGGMLASKAEMEAASATDHVVSPGLMNDHPGMMKCWVSFDQVTPAILAEHNTSSVTDSATGRSTTVWDTDFSATTYATGGTALAGVANHGVELIASTKLTTGCGYACKNFAGNLDGDTTDLNIWAAGDQ